jgi:hypothetical protein
MIGFAHVLVGGCCLRVEGKINHGWTRINTDEIWTAVAERSGDTAFSAAVLESGVALRFPPQSKTGNRMSFATEKYPCKFVFIRG